MVESPGDRVLVLFSYLGFNTGVFPDTWVPFWDLLKLGMTLLGDINRGPGPSITLLTPPPLGQEAMQGERALNATRALEAGNAFLTYPEHTAASMMWGGGAIYGSGMLV